MAMMKIPAETLKLRTILFKLFLMLANLFRSVSGMEKRARDNDAEQPIPGFSVLIHYRVGKYLT
jgi:hypothetical protein